MYASFHHFDPVSEAEITGMTLRLIIITTIYMAL